MYLIIYQTESSLFYFKDANHGKGKNTAVWVEGIEDAMAWANEKDCTEILEVIREKAKNPLAWAIVWIDSKKKKRR
jgi:hypothetical protein